MDVPRRPTLSHPKKPILFAIPADTLVKRLFWFLVFLEIGLVLIDFSMNLGGFTPHKSISKIFNLAREDSFPTWVGTLQLAAVAGVLALIYRLEKKEEKPAAHPLLWIILACLFLYMAIDDASKIHERVGTWLVDIAYKLNFPSYAWQLIFAPIFGAMALIIFMIQQRAFGWTKWGFLLLLGIGCWVAAVAMDYVEGLERYAEWAAQIGWKEYTLKHGQKVIEEVTEMFGCTLFLTTFTWYLTRRTGEVKITLS